MPNKESEPTREEMEFLEYELDLLIKQYCLQDFGDSLVASFYLLNEMVTTGLIEKSWDGMMKGMDIIVKRFPTIDDSFRKFAAAVYDKTAKEMKQLERPN